MIWCICYKEEMIIYTVLWEETMLSVPLILSKLAHDFGHNCRYQIVAGTSNWYNKRVLPGNVSYKQESRICLERDVRVMAYTSDVSFFVLLWPKCP